jgi:hypothetical protein
VAGVTVTGIPEVEGLLRAMSERAADLSPAMGGPMSDLIESHFLNRMANQGPGWAPLAASTRAARSRPGRGLGGIGYDRGPMFNSLMNPQAAGAVKVVTPTGVSRGTAVESSRGFRYAEMFHLGSRTSGKQPARDMVGDVSILVSPAEAILDRFVRLGAL